MWMNWNIWTYESHLKKKKNKNTLISLLITKFDKYNFQGNFKIMTNTYINIFSTSRSVRLIKKKILLNIQHNLCFLSGSYTQFIIFIVLELFFTKDFLIIETIDTKYPFETRKKKRKSKAGNYWFYRSFRETC